MRAAAWRAGPCLHPTPGPSHSRAETRWADGVWSLEGGTERSGVLSREVAPYSAPWLGHFHGVPSNETRVGGVSVQL